MAHFIYLETHYDSNCKKTVAGLTAIYLAVINLHEMHFFATSPQEISDSEYIMCIKCII